MNTRAVFGLTIVGVVLAAAGSLAAGARPRSPGDAEPVPRDPEAAAASSNAFALNLYGRLREQEGNLFLSPFSISTALAMTYAGAAGETAEEMAEVLHLGPDAEAAHRSYGGLTAALRKGGDGNTLQVANALWPQEGYALLENFTNTVKQHYGAGLQPVDYVSATEEARKTINAWVERQTKDKIKDLIKPGVLTSLTRLVLTNAIYFKGTWEAQFDEESTEDRPFHVAEGQSVTVPTMHQQRSYGYYEDDRLQALELPYAGERLAMVVLLPKDMQGLSAMEQGLDLAMLQRCISGLRQQEVAVYLPRFKTTSQFGLGQVLAALGMPLAFDVKRADFSGMTGNRELFISAVVHKAFVDVNEEGTEAAAATAVVMAVESAAPAQPKIFRADHPFLFLIRDRESGAILFLGRVADPTQSGG